MISTPIVPGRDERRTVVMGVVNVTPDSFSDGGQWFDHDTAIAHGIELVEQGAAVVDVGGESTRPGAPSIDRSEEQRRVIPVVSALAAERIAVSVDTMWAATAEQALAAGAVLVNDVSGGRADPAMLPLVAAADVPFVVMHWRAHSAEMQNTDHTAYQNVVDEVIDEMLAQVDRAIAAGIRPENVIVDPGLGFSKTGEQNWELLAALDRFAGLEYRALIAASRKSFLGALLADRDEPRSPAGRDVASAAIAGHAARAGVWGVRVHDVLATCDVLAVNERLRQETVHRNETGGPT